MSMSASSTLSLDISLRLQRHWMSEGRSCLSSLSYIRVRSSSCLRFTTIVEKRASSEGSKSLILIVIRRTSPPISGAVASRARKFNAVRGLANLKSWRFPISRKRECTLDINQAVRSARDTAISRDENSHPQGKEWMRRVFALGSKIILVQSIRNVVIELYREI